jgi:broad specificity phosphatase PhoE
MTLFYLVRHGQIARDHAAVDPADPPLSAMGRVEAAQVAAFLASRPITRVYASDLRRAQETAAPIAARFGLPVIVEPLLRERMNFGDLPGQTLDEFAALWERCSRERDFVPPVGDSSRAAGQRVERFMAAVHADVPHGEVVAVAHGGLIADFLFNIAPLDALAQISPAFVADPYAGEVMRNGAMTVVEFGGEEGACYAVKQIAGTGHLP